MIKIIGLIKLIRPINCLMMGLAVVIGEVIALKGLLILQPAILGFLTAFFLTAGTMALNDYYDLEVDLINEPSRPIPSGLIKPKEALACALICVLIGISASAAINLSSFIIALISLVLMVYYNTKGKKTGLPGNFIVSTCVALPFIYGGYTVNNMNFTLWIFALMAFLANTGREIVKGIADIKGDKIEGIKTLAATIGAYKASITAILFFLIAIILSFIPAILNFTSLIYIPIVAFSDLGFIVSSISLIKNQSIKNAKKVKNRILLFMFIGLIAFIVGSL
ncbi:MAG: UbiA family prenyltransferase [Candidatus Bathyarchaeia archaeon]|nr:UbiA family prenyltransferase [Candidatus Bathyarchaeota archaeon]